MGKPQELLWLVPTCSAFRSGKKCQRADLFAIADFLSVDARMPSNRFFIGLGMFLAMKKRWWAELQGLAVSTLWHGPSE
ncbi:MAG: hypothetical protein DWH91_01025 [Planctomycetota bacterium]|nr:MAG: hypothetical protein DWH91_01025 [Planctomycetota bacterium]